MFEILSTIVKYIFVTAIYFFMFSIIRLVYFDIKRNRMGTIVDDEPYLKLVNRRSTLKFRVEESYSIRDKSTVGRGARADIIIADPFLSSVHVQFLREGDSFVLVDNNSTNGTFVNGEKVEGEPCLIKTGDLIKIGQLMFIFVDPAGDE